MEKLYDTQPYTYRFSGKVFEVKEAEGKLHILLDKTAFYPGGGGQRADTGMLKWTGGMAKVVEVQDREGHIWHVCEAKGKLFTGEIVEGEIDWEGRYTMMKSHTAEHTLFHCMLDLFPLLKMVKVQITPEGSAIFATYPGDLDLNTLLEAEKKANDLIAANLPVSVKECTKETVPEKTRAKLERIDSETVRVVDVGEHDSCACAGLHVKSTGEIGLIATTGVTRELGVYKISFLVGKQALDYLLSGKKSLQSLSTILRTTPDKLEKTAFNLREERDRLSVGMKELAKLGLSSLTPEKTSSLTLYSHSFLALDPKLLMERAGELIREKGVVVVFASEEREHGTLVLAKSEDISLDLRAVATKAFAAMDGKWGGKDDFLTGAGEAAKLAEAFKVAVAEVKK